MKEAPMPAPEAVIEIGSTGVRLLVAEFTEDGKRNVLDRAEMPVSLGRDVFTSGIISRETQRLGNYFFTNYCNRNFSIPGSKK